MKIKTSLLAAACTLALSASAATFTPGGQTWPPTADDYAGGQNATALFDLSYSASASQNIFSKTQLSGLPAKTNADGSQEVVKIQSVELPFYMGMAYALEGEANITVYLTPYNSDTLPLDASQPQWIDFSSDATVKGTATITSYDDDVLEAAYGEDMVVVKVEFTTPYEYTEGAGFVMTVQAESSLADSSNDFWFMGTYQYLAVSQCSAMTTETVDLTGSVASAKGTVMNVLPVVNFTYEVEHKEAAGGETVGDAAVYKVGDYDGCSAGDESETSAYLPITGDHYKYSFSQIIYTRNELPGLYTTGENIVKADITDLTFKLANSAYDMFNGTITGKVYIQNFDGTTFPIVDNAAQWIAYDKTVSGTFATDELSYDCPDDIELTAVFDTPLRYEGGSLLVTFVADCSEFESQYQTLEDYTYPTSGIQSAVTASDSQALDELTGNAVNPSKWVPVLKLGYKPVTVAATVKPVLFENVAVALNKVDVAEGLFYNVTKANSVTISFDLVNAEETGKYDISFGNTDLGTVTGSHGVISFVNVPKTDIVLSVTPQAEGGIGGTATVAADDINALFPVPSVEVADKAAYAQYSVWENPHNNPEPTKSATVQLAAKFKMTTDAPVAVMKGEPSDSQIKVVSSSLEPECFADFAPKGEYNDYEANEGYISFSLNNSNTLSASISKGQLVTPANKNIDVKFSMKYPVISKSVPVLGTAAVAEVTSSTGYTSSDVTVDYDNGESWGKTTCSAKFDFAANDPEIVVDVTHTDNLLMHHDQDNKELTFYAPAGHKIHYSWTPDPDFASENAPARVKALAEQEIDWTEHDSNIYTHSTETPGTLVVKNVDADGNDGDTMIYTINGDGTTTGFDSVAVDNAAAPAEYFDLQGRRVANPSAGLYTIRQGGKVSKVLVK